MTAMPVWPLLADALRRGRAYFIAAGLMSLVFVWRLADPSSDSFIFVALIPSIWALPMTAIRRTLPVLRTLPLEQREIVRLVWWSTTGAGAITNALIVALLFAAGEWRHGAASNPILLLLYAVGAAGLAVRIATGQAEPGGYPSATAVVRDVLYRWPILIAMLAVIFAYSFRSSKSWVAADTLNVAMTIVGTMGFITAALAYWCPEEPNRSLGKKVSLDLSFGKRRVPEPQSQTQRKRAIWSAAGVLAIGAAIAWLPEHYPEFFQRSSAFIILLFALAASPVGMTACALRVSGMRVLRTLPISNAKIIRLLMWPSIRPALVGILLAAAVDALARFATPLTLVADALFILAVQMLWPGWSLYEMTMSSAQRILVSLVIFGLGAAGFYIIARGDTSLAWIASPLIALGGLIWAYRALSTRRDLEWRSAGYLT